MGNYSYNKYDIKVIPDRYNTGLTNPSADFIIITTESTKMGAINLRKVDNGFYIDWNNGGNKALSGEIIIENYDFQTNDFKLGTMNAWGYTNESGVSVLFRNCKFTNVSLGSESNSLITSYVEDCVISDGIICSHGYVKNSTVTSLNGSDGINGDHVLFENVYVYDLDKPSDSSTTGHQDGVQFFSGDDYELKNVRIEFPAINYSYHKSNWSTNLFIQTDTTNATVDNCIFSGRHPNSYLVHVVNSGVTVTDTMFQENSFYPGGLSLVDCNDSKILDSMYVSSVFKSDDKINIIATNDTFVPRTMKVTTNKGDTIFNFNQYWQMNDYAVDTKSFADYPIDINCQINADGIEWLVCFDVTDLANPIQIRYVEFEVPTRDKIDSIELPTGTYELKDANSFYAEDIATVINEDSTDEEIPSALAVYNLGSTSGYELKSNKLTSLTLTATDDNYMSAKWLYDLLGWLQESPERPIIPKTGTWQLKPEYQNKKYICIGTDDDNNGNTKVYRMLRTYNFPYKMNTASGSVTDEKNLGSDVDECFTSEDAPSLFPNYTTTVNEVAEYIHNNPQTGEVAMHGFEPLWDSSKLSGTYWNELYSKYVSDGGTKSEADLKAEIMVKGASRDVAQGASVVSDYRQVLEDTLGFYISSVGIWGGGYLFTLDEGITVDLKRFYNNDYPWRDNDYMYAGTKLNSGSGGSHNPWKGIRRSIIVDIGSKIDEISNGDLVDFYTHWWGDFTPEQWRTILDTIKSYVDLGQLEVVTGEQYYKMGEFV